MMKRIETFFLVILLAAVALLVAARVRMSEPAAVPASGTGKTTPQPVDVTADTPAPEPTAEPKEFVLSFVGDCTLNSSQNFVQSDVGYAARMNGDYAYPFSNTVQYFKDDDMTFANLECTLSDRKLSSLEQFYFISPTEWTNILLEGGVDFVTTANNHMADFGDRGKDDTFAALESYGIPYGKEGEAQIVTTESGLKIGVYCDYNHLKPTQEDAVAAIRRLKADGAEYILCMFHWGDEIHYTPKTRDQELAHACIDAGANLVYGSHTHNLQPIEEYNGGVILYSMGNWTFGGSTMPTDPDTAIVQVTVTRASDGTVSNTGLDVIPCSATSQPWVPKTHYNDYRPTPYEEGSEGYGRVLSKLDGSFEPDSEGRDYSDYYASWG